MPAAPETGRTAPKVAARFAPLLAAGCLIGVVTWRLATTVRRVAQRVQFPYDLMYWPDDYYLSVVLRLEHGLSPYGNPADANSWIYAPGGPLLGWGLLKPLGLQTSYFAHKLLGQLWFAVAVAAGALLGRALIASALEHLPARAAGGLSHEQRRVSGFEIGLLASILALAGYMNPVADSLHPTNLELAGLCAASWLGLRFSALEPQARLGWCALLPALALCFKQTGAVAIVVSLIAYAAFTEGLALRERLRLAFASLLAPALVFGLMRGLWGPDFTAWVWTIPSSAGVQEFKTRDLTSGLGLLVYPMLALVLARIVIAVRHRSEPAERAYLRACLPTLCYTPLALLALFKTLGGPNNLMVLLFLYTALGAPLLIMRLTRGPALSQVLHALVLIACTLSLWSPKKRLPAQADFEYGARLCEYLRARQACGERVYLGRGAVCFLGGTELPLDRVMAAEDVSQSSYPLGYGARLRSQHYDVVIATQKDLFSPWLKHAQWPALRENYSPFGRLDAGPHGDVWTEGFGDLMGPTAFFERARDRGKHSLQHPARCERAAVAPPR